MRCLSCSKPGLLLHVCVGMRSNRRVLALCCLLVFLALSSVLLLSDFFSCSVSAQESNLGVWSAWDYRLFNTYTRWDDLANDRHFEWNHTGRENTAVYDSSHDLTSIGYGNLLGVNAVAATNLFQVRVTPMSNPVTIGTFHILPDYVDQTATVPVTLNIITSPAAIAAINPTYYLFRLYLDDGSFISGVYQSQSRSVSSYSTRLTVTFKFTFPSSSVGKDIVYFDLYYNINMTFNQDGGPGDIGINFSFDIPDFTLTPSDSTVDAAAAVSAGVNSANETLFGGIADSTSDVTSSAVESDREISVVLGSSQDFYSAYSSPFDLDAESFFPLELRDGFKGLSFVINHFASLPWLRIMLQWSLSLGTLAFVFNLFSSIRSKYHG